MSSSSSKRRSSVISNPFEMTRIDEDYTTIDPLNFALRAKTIRAMVFWSLITIASTVAVIGVVASLAIKYESQQTEIVIKLKESRAPFPAVTFCNLNPYKRSAVANIPNLRYLVASMQNPSISKDAGKFDVGSLGNQTGDKESEIKSEIKPDSSQVSTIRLNETTGAKRDADDQVDAGRPIGDVGQGTPEPTEPVEVQGGRQKRKAKAKAKAPPCRCDMSTPPAIVDRDISKYAYYLHRGRNITFACAFKCCGPAGRLAREIESDMYEQLVTSGHGFWVAMKCTSVDTCQWLSGTTTANIKAIGKTFNVSDQCPMCERLSAKTGGGGYLSYNVSSKGEIAFRNGLQTNAIGPYLCQVELPATTSGPPDISNSTASGNGNGSTVTTAATGNQTISSTTVKSGAALFATPCIVNVSTVAFENTTTTFFEGTGANSSDWATRNANTTACTTLNSDNIEDDANSTATETDATDTGQETTDTWATGDEEIVNGTDEISNTTEAISTKMQTEESEDTEGPETISGAANTTVETNSTDLTDITDAEQENTTTSMEGTWSTEAPETNSTQEQWSSTSLTEEQQNTPGQSTSESMQNTSNDATLQPESTTGATSHEHSPRTMTDVPNSSMLTGQTSSTVAMDMNSSTVKSLQPSTASHSTVQGSSMSANATVTQQSSPNSTLPVPPNVNNQDSSTTISAKGARSSAKTPVSSADSLSNSNTNLQTGQPQSGQGAPQASHQTTKSTQGPQSSSSSSGMQASAGLPDASGNSPSSSAPTGVFTAKSPASEKETTLGTDMQQTTGNAALVHSHATVGTTAGTGSISSSASRSPSESSLESSSKETLSQNPSVEDSSSAGSGPSADNTMTKETTAVSQSQSSAKNTNTQTTVQKTTAGLQSQTSAKADIISSTGAHITTQQQQLDPTIPSSSQNNLQSTAGGPTSIATQQQGTQNLEPQMSTRSSQSSRTSQDMTDVGSSTILNITSSAATSPPVDASDTSSTSALITTASKADISTVSLNSQGPQQTIPISGQSTSATSEVVNAESTLPAEVASDNTNTAMPIDSSTVDTLPSAETAQMTVRSTSQSGHTNPIASTTQANPNTESLQVTAGSLQTGVTTQAINNMQNETSAVSSMSTTLDKIFIPSTQSAEHQSSTQFSAGELGSKNAIGDPAVSADIASQGGSTVLAEAVTLEYAPHATTAQGQIIPIDSNEMSTGQRTQNLESTSAQTSVQASAGQATAQTPAQSLPQTSVQNSTKTTAQISSHTSVQNSENSPTLTSAQTLAETSSQTTGQTTARRPLLTSTINTQTSTPTTTLNPEHTASTNVPSSMATSEAHSKPTTNDITTSLQVSSISASTSFQSSSSTFASLQSSSSSSSTSTSSTDTPRSTAQHTTTAALAPTLADLAANISTDTVQAIAETLNDPEMQKNAAAMGQTLSDMIPYLMSSIPEDLAIAAGYTSSESIMWCYYDGVRCYPENFTLHVDSDYGNCYTFNAGGERMTSSQAGLGHGLTVAYATSEDEYLQFVQTAGIRISIHPRDEPIFPALNGFDVCSGYRTQVGLKRIQINGLSTEKKPCATSSEDVAVYCYNETMYSTEACVRSCYQKDVIDSCMCKDPRIPSLKNLAVESCNISMMKCVSDKYTTNKTLCDCPPACKGELYEISMSKVGWDPNKELLEIYNHKAQGGRNQWALIDISFDDLIIMEYRESVKYTVSDLLWDFSSIVGLFLGMSVLSVFEILDLFMYLWRKIKK